ncbi:conserved hypothetical protein [Thermobaculum terrenum ATCC BAA-798]|uniref:Amino acid permease-associated region n=1 Tax=Thermobaculum terrenum (strain ATCC BAA-798 / CCMEE 7001 / YNP1) TaxID=525904 RepID=D1CGV1_THET1|nr:APC family permease [Thermobaculum terrenum]ACZ42972.1 conserved hypothetical protein [Thermobaculum terrenum ATCC BAA-798]
MNGNDGRGTSSRRISYSDLEKRQLVRGAKPGNRFVRVQPSQEFYRTGPGWLVPRPDVVEPKGLLGRLRRLIVGRPIPSALEVHERLNKIKGLAVLSSDAISSVAYGPEATMRILITAGLAYLSFTWPIAIAIALLIAIVAFSYRQTIKAYPSGGGSYIVASENLGPIPGLVAASSLLFDYILTVAVSIASGTAAITSLFPRLLPYTVEITVAAILFIMIVNLRGIRESGTVFTLPPYVFIVSVYVTILVGLYKLTLGGGIHYTPPPSAVHPGGRQFGLLLLLAAFSEGCSAMTGTEAIANGVPAFKPPEWRNARTTMSWMAIILATLVLGVGFLATHMHVLPATDETVLSQIGRSIFGPGPMWWVLQVSTALILVLAATTAFMDFPRLMSILAKDRYAPRVFQYRGDRLAFTSGIIALSVVAIVLELVFKGSVEKLIPLYAVGVFTSFTLSQAGMVVHWRRERERGWRRSAIINGVGAVITGIVTLIIGITKFTHGAWLVIVLVPVAVLTLWAIHKHYVRLETTRKTEIPMDPQQIRLRAVVPIRDLGVQAKQAVAFAQAITRQNAQVVAVHVEDDPQEAEELRKAWYRWNPEVELLIIESPYRSLLRPLLAYISALKETYPDDTVVVVLPEFVPSHWWEQLLHNQTALRIKAALLFYPGVVVANVPYHLEK